MVDHLFASRGQPCLQTCSQNTSFAYTPTTILEKSSPRLCSACCEQCMLLARKLKVFKCARLVKTQFKHRQLHHQFSLFQTHSLAPFCSSWLPHPRYCIHDSRCKSSALRPYAVSSHSYFKRQGIVFIEVPPPTATDSAASSLNHHSLRSPRHSSGKSKLPSDKPT